MPPHKICQSDNPNWRTPGWLRTAVYREFLIGLDAAADATPGCPLADTYCGPGGVLENALCGVPWADILLDAVAGAAIRNDVDPAALRVANRAVAVWCNPPYSRKQAVPIEPWVRAGAECGQRATCVMLLPHAHQTRWWRQYVESPDPRLRAAEIRPFPFRIAFDPPPDYAGHPHGSNVNHALVIWSPHTAAFVEPWTPHRVTYDPRNPAVPGDRLPAAPRARRRRAHAG